MVQRTFGVLVLSLFIFVIVATPYAWAESRHFTILYSNNINGRINPSG
jgi:hypothetical protein